MSDHGDGQIQQEHGDLIAELERRDDVDLREQEIGRLGKMFDEEEIEELPDDEILETSGLLSQVLDSDSEEIGHTLMIEWDDIDDVLRPIRTADRLPGVSVLLRSSPGSYHLYNMSVRDRDEQLLDAVRKNGDVWQARWAARRGYFVLRILPKIRSESREIYKPAPEPVRVFTTESEHPQSKPHIEMLLNLAADAGQDEVAQDLATALDEYETIGDGLRADHYQTVTDEAKELIDR